MAVIFRALLITLLIQALPLYAAEEPVSRVTAYVEAGYYNSAYKDREYLNEYGSFPVLIKSFSLEYFNRDSESFIQGGGLAVSDISEGRKYNFNRYEEQVHEFVILPYCFIGYDFHYASVELGVSTYLSYKKFPSRFYYSPDGTTTIERTEGVYLDRESSHVFPNFAIRLLPERIFHFKLKFGREYFSPVDSLTAVSFSVPFGMNKIETLVSLKTYLDIFPVSNQRVTVLYTRRFDPFTAGVALSYLVYNEHGGGRGDIGIADIRNLTAGLRFSLMY